MNITKHDVTNKLWRVNNLYKIRTKDKGIIRFKFNSIQQKIAEDVKGINPTRHFSLKSRQVGLSTFWLLWWLDDTIFNKGIVTGVLAHKLESINHLSSIVKIALSNIPGLPTKLDEDNKTRISFASMDSTIIFSLEIRSSPLHNLHISEWCFCDNDRIWATLGATSKWTNITGESTGHGIGNDGYMTYMDAKEGKNGYLSRFIPWYDHPEYRMPLNGLRDYVPDKRERLANLNQEQIHFRRQMQHRLKSAFFVEYPETEEDAFAQSGANFFNNKKVVILAKEARGKEPLEETDRYIIWEKPQHDHIYAMGVDVAEGIEGDYSVFKVLCRTCRQEAMRYRDHVGLDTFYRDINTWGIAYKKCLVGVERNNHGHAILLGLREMCKYPNLYFEKAKPTRLIEKMDKVPQEKKYGWHTTPQTKAPMLDRLQIAIEGNSEEDENTFQPEFTVYDTGFLSECLTFQKDGVKLQAVSGKHDDNVMATGIAFQMYLQVGKRLASGSLDQVLTGAEREHKT